MEGKGKKTDHPGSLTEMNFENERFVIRTIFETFLKHADSIDNDISEEITLNLKGTGPSSLRIHETFPILTLQDGTHFCSFALDRQLYETMRED